MLEAFRKQSRSILIYVFFGIIIAVFVINFGPQSQGCSTAGTTKGAAATVGGEELSGGAFFLGWFLYRGRDIPPERARQARLKERIMNDLIQRELLAQQAERLGLTVSNRDVEEMLEKGEVLWSGRRVNLRGFFFKKDRFDADMLERFVRYELNLSLKRFIAEQQREMLAERMRELLRASVVVSPAEVRRAYDQENLKVNLEFVRFVPRTFVLPAPTEAEVDAFVKGHKKEIEQYYQSHLYEFTKLEPQVRVRRVLFRAAADAKPAVANRKQAQARAALARVKKGEKLAALAAKLSEDETTKAAGGDLGWRKYDALGMGAEAEQKIRATKPGEVVGEVLRTPEGFEVVEVVAKREGDQKLAQVERDIARKLLVEEGQRQHAKQRAEETLAKLKGGAKLSALFEKAETEEEPPATQPAKRAKPAEPPGTPRLQETGLFERRGSVVSQIGVSPELAKAAFDLKPDHPLLDRVYEVQGTFIVATLKERQDPDPAAFDKVRDDFARQQQLQKWGEVLADWTQKQCVSARDAGRINVNQDILAYETRQGLVQPTAYQPCN